MAHQSPAYHRPGFIFLDTASHGKIKSILNAVVVIVLVIWVLQAFGILGSLRNINIR